jgi:hypothetical protein
MAALLNSSAVLGGVRALPARPRARASAKAVAPVAAAKRTVSALRVDAKAAAAVAGAWRGAPAGEEP